MTKIILRRFCKGAMPPSYVYAHYIGLLHSADKYYDVILGNCITGASSVQTCGVNTTCHTGTGDLTASTCMCRPGYATTDVCVLKGIAITVEPVNTVTT